MPVTLEEFSRDFYNQHGDEIAKLLSPEQVLKGIGAAKLLEAMSPEQRVQGLSAEELLRLADKRRRQENQGKAKLAPRKRKKS